MTQHEILKKYILGLTKGYSTSLIICSSPGLGKTETTLETLKELGCQEGTHFKYIQNYITPVELFLLLEEVNKLEKPQILVLDDIEDTLSNSRAIGLLKGALWGFEGHRKVSWQSGTYRIKEKEIEFTGRIIFLLNKINTKNPIINALKDRSLYFEFQLTQQEIKSLILERAKKEYLNTSYSQRLKVAEFLNQNGYILSLRDYPKVLNLFLLSPNHWQELTSKLLT